MASVTYQLDRDGQAVPQTSTDGAADVVVNGGAVGIDPTLNAVTILPLPVAAAGPSNASNTALAASLIVKAGAGRLFRVNGTNTKVSAQFVQIHDSATLPAEGAVPKVVISVAASTPYTIDFGIYGRLFSAGIVICNSSTAATKTIGSADILSDAQFL